MKKFRGVIDRHLWCSHCMFNFAPGEHAQSSCGERALEAIGETRLCAVSAFIPINHLIPLDGRLYENWYRR